MPRQSREHSHFKVYHAILRGVNKQQIFECSEDYEHFVLSAQRITNISFISSSICVDGRLILDHQSVTTYKSEGNLLPNSRCRSQKNWMTNKSQQSAIASSMPGALWETISTCSYKRMTNPLETP